MHTTVRGIEIQLGERELSAEAIAQSHGVSVAAVERSKGQTRVYATTGTKIDLVLSAARRTLAGSSLGGADLDAIIWTGRITDALNGENDRLYAQLQNELGAKNAFTMHLGYDCTETVNAARVAQLLIKDGLRNVLVTGVASIDPGAPRTIRKLTEETYSSLFSDAGAAFLVQAGERPSILGFGFSTDGRYWDYQLKWRRFFAGELPASELPNDLLMLNDFRAMHRVALARCFEHAGLAAAEVDHVILPIEAGPIAVSLSRQLGFADKLYIPDASPSHIGVCDVFYSLKRLLESDRVKAGQVVLLVSRAVGSMRVLALRV